MDEPTKRQIIVDIDDYVPINLNQTDIEYIKEGLENILQKNYYIKITGIQIKNIEK